MGEMITIFTITARAEPRFPEMADALARFATMSFEWLIVDALLWYEPEQRKKMVQEAVHDRFPVRHVTPKPCVWQGPTRLTKADYPGLQNARNTALCYAKGDYLIELDDCCLPGPAWMAHYAQARKKGVGLAMRNQSVRKDKIVNGLLLEGEPADDGDGRGKMSKRCEGSWMWGFSAGYPIDRVLMVNGWDEIYDSIFGGCDVDLGVRIWRTGLALFYDAHPEAMINQLLDTHHYAPGAILDGYQNPEWGGIGKSSHKPDNQLSQRSPKELKLETGRVAFANEFLIQRLAYDNRRSQPIGNYYDILTLRHKCQDGEPFPVPTWPERHWCDGQPLSEMD